MNFKKTLSAVLAGLMLVGGAVTASAGKVYTREDFPQYYTYNHSYYNPYYYYYTPYYNNIFERGPVTPAVLNPLTGKYDNCLCPYCTGHADLSGYYWVNGVLYSAKDYYVNYAPHTTVTVEPTTAPVTDPSKETGVTYYESSIPSGVIKRKPAAEENKGNIIVTDGTVNAVNPALVGSYNKYITIPGTYYAYDKVDLSTYFNKNFANLHMTVDEIQTFGTGFKMISADSSIVKVVNDYQGQKLVAKGVGSTNVYLYTGGGVPFMKLSVTVVNSAYGFHNGYIDVEVGSWKLDKVGDSTPIVVKIDENRKNDTVKLEVVKGEGYIKDGKLYATGLGAIVVKAYSTSNTSVQGYAIVYVGQYVDALYEGYWTSTNGNISCNYWNPNLWGCGGYKINGWVLTTSGAYLPVISKVETTTEKADGTTSTTTTTIYSDLYDLLYGDCHGSVDSVYKLLWKNGKLTSTATSSSKLWEAAMQEIIDDIAEDYAKQMNKGN